MKLETEIANISNQQQSPNKHTTNKIANFILCNKSKYEFNALHVRTFFCVQVIWGFSSLVFRTHQNKSVSRETLKYFFQWQFVYLGLPMAKDLVEKIAFSSIKYFLCVCCWKMFRSDLCWLVHCVVAAPGLTSSWKMLGERAQLDFNVRNWAAHKHNRAT